MSESPFSPIDQALIGQAMEFSETEAAKERRAARVQQRQAFVEIQMQALMDEVRALRKQVADYNRDKRIEDSHTAADLAQLKEQVDGLKQWVVRLVRDKEAGEIETVCAWCKTHLSGPVGAEKVSHGICPQCLEREFPEMVQEAVA